MTLHASQLLLRFYVERVGDQWQAHCIDLDLAAQGDSMEDAQRKIAAMAVSYLVDALGPDIEHADVLLLRRAPLRYVLKYHWLTFLQRRAHRQALKRRIAYQRPMPLSLQAQGC